MSAGWAAWARAAACCAALLAGGPAARADGPRVVEISAKRFSFTPSEVHLRRGEPVVLRVRSADVTHGLWLKPLGIDAEIRPGETTEVTVTPEVPGRFTAICHHFCGAGHGNMHMTFVVE